MCQARCKRLDTRKEAGSAASPDPETGASTGPEKACSRTHESDTTRAQGTEACEQCNKIQGATSYVEPPPSGALRPAVAVRQRSAWIAGGPEGFSSMAAQAADYRALLGRSHSLLVMVTGKLSTDDQFTHQIAKANRSTLIHRALADQSLKMAGRDWSLIAMIIGAALLLLVYSFDLTLGEETVLEEEVEETDDVFMQKLVSVLPNIAA